ncbi:MAG: OsmC family protein [Candidatus Eisenbacteria bacterium]|uniref:OsmC family protein n=1 Tax=Eiseniibacteriota bacterium TaxID=2212470 RepID=A0A956NBE2_UNCEI|nr:OsmC family protein [Candidatus Eisenbacteria bacterium]
MASHVASIEWVRRGEPFVDNRYSRSHVWRFDGGTEVPASSSPHVVPLPFSVERAVDPEEAFVASLSSCHMLWFLSLAAGRGFVVDSYIDEAEGRMGRAEDGKLAFERVELRPRVLFAAGAGPTAEELKMLHHLAHEECFLARSVRCAVECRPRD